LALAVASGHRREAAHATPFVVKEHRWGAAVGTEEGVATMIEEQHFRPVLSLIVRSATSAPTREEVLGAAPATPRGS
jgi:hypothetical protein